MPDPNTQGTIVGIVVILAVLGLIFLRIMLVRFVSNVLQNPSGRFVLGMMMCIGGLIYGFSTGDTPDQNRLTIGMGVAVGGLLLLLITVGIPYLNKRWLDAAATKPTTQAQNWDAPVTPPPPGIPYMPVSQPGGPLPPAAPGGYYPIPGSQQSGTWPAPNMQYPPYPPTSPPLQ